MSKKTLRPFQNLAVDSGMDVFMAARELLDAAGGDAAGRRMAVNENGYLLIEAPTGAGKTLIAGTLVEKFSKTEDVVWFWFAPFKGVTAQTENFIKEEFSGLRIRSLSDDRQAALTQRGDVFVTTWGSVATRMKDKRNVRKDGESNSSIDSLILRLRDKGLRIGVVVDEAHHGFGRETQAAEFFKKVLQPEYTILITATPDDADVKEFEKSMQIGDLKRITISRPDVVAEGLIKEGIRCAAYIAPPDQKMLVDLEGTALRDGVSAHRKVKKTLEELGVGIVPLLLVQADSKEGSIERLRARLLQMGFTDEQVATHTAEEPDSGLMEIANDDRREVLIFKMAVALGFDAPRAFTLVSMRAARDADFGVQLVGRILRVHRLLHARARAKDLPDALTHGSVFLSVPEQQSGLDKAGQKINAMQTSYATASTALIVGKYGDGRPGVTHVSAQGQIELLGLEAEETGGGKSPFEKSEDGDDRGEDFQPSEDFDFAEFFSQKPRDSQDPKDTGIRAGTALMHRYPLRAGMPQGFKTQLPSPNNDVTEEDCANRFIVSTRQLFEVLKSRVPVERRTLNVFTREMQQEFNFAADISPAQAAKTAEKILKDDKIFDSRELRLALLRKMALVMREEAMAEADDTEKIAHFLDVILTTHPDLLRDAQKKALAESAEILDAAELPKEFLSEEILSTSPKNIYGVLPKMNTWEVAFAEMLDGDPNGIVKWWHRNPSQKPWSVNVLMTNGRRFFPDFVVGIEGRKTEGNILLADPKERFETAKEAQKIHALHQAYGKVLILAKDGARWMTVEYDDEAKKPIATREFRLSDTPGF